VVKDVAKPSDERDPGVQSDPLQQLTSLQKSGASQPQALKQVETTASKAVIVTATGATTQQDADRGRITSEERSMQGQPGGQTPESVDDLLVDNTDTQTIDNSGNPPKTPEKNQWRISGVVLPSSPLSEPIEHSPEKLASKTQSKRLRSPQPSPEKLTPETQSKRLKTTQSSQGGPASATGPKKSKANQPLPKRPASETQSNKSKTNRLTLIVKLRIGSVANPPSSSPDKPNGEGFEARQRKRLQDAISKGASDNALVEVQQLLASCPISFIPGDATYDLDAADVLSLPYFAGSGSDSWFSDNVIYALSRIEGEYVHDAYAELELNPWFSGTSIEDLSKYIKDAEEGIHIQRRWPFANWKPQHNRCVAVINPSDVHWMAVEVSFAGNSPVVRCFNSMPIYDEEDGSYRKIVHGIPKLLCLATFRPDWPMGQFSLEDINFKHVKCPRQAIHSGDCGPLTFLCLARRLHDLPAFPDQIKLDTNKMRAAFGQWVRERCIHALWSRCHDTSFDTLFTELVDIDGFAAIESVDISARQAGQADSEVRVARPTRLTMDSLDQLAYTDSRSADKPSSSEIYNLEFGEKRQGTLFVVIVFRWSGPPPWGRWDLKTRQQCIDRLIDSARDRLRSYLHQSGHTEAEIHVTIVAGGLIPTRDVPHTDDNERNARATLGSATTLSDSEAVICPFEGCSRSYNDTYRYLSHLRHDHILDPLPVGWYRCLYANLTRIYATHCFGELTATQRTRLINSCQRSKNKLFQCAWFPTECIKSGLIDKKAMHQHCQSSHLDNIWPFVPTGEETCGAVFQTQGQLDKHHLESHILPGGPVRFTTLIDDALKRACRAAIEFGDDNPLPVLLSAGTDGFTCNTIKFSEWMEAKKFEFTLAIIEQTTILDTKYLLNDSEYHLGQYNSLTLTEAIDNLDEASDKYKDIVRVW
jgi:hypothetical protein